MREVVRRGEQALLLVPEISLTPVFASRLKERFGERIAILHSSLSASERFDQWWRARRGEVDVAIGPRSALFTPFQRLGLIVVDEEGDGAYKQEETPRYNARDLAVVRAQFRSIPIVLGSATPSLESRENAARGKYTLLRMMSRVEARPLPEVEVIDLRKERAEKEDKGFVIFSNPLKERLQGDVRRRGAGHHPDQSPRLRAVSAMPRVRPRVPLPRLQRDADRAPPRRAAHLPLLRTAQADPGEVSALQRRGAAADRLRHGESGGALPPRFSRTSPWTCSIAIRRARKGSWSASSTASAAARRRR